MLADGADVAGATSAAAARATAYTIPHTHSHNLLASIGFSLFYCINKKLCGHTMWEVRQRAKKKKKNSQICLGTEEHLRLALWSERREEKEWKRHMASAGICMLALQGASNGTKRIFMLISIWIENLFRTKKNKEKSEIHTFFTRGQ